MYDIPKSTAYHPVLQLVFLICFFVLGAVLGIAVGAGIWFAFDSEASVATMQIQDPTQMNVNFLRLTQTGMEIGGYILGPFSFVYLLGEKPLNYFNFDRKLNFNLFFLVVLIIICSIPFFQWIGELNQAMSFPDSLKSIEDWMREQEISQGDGVERLLRMDSLIDLFICLFIVSILTGIGEELLFRGGLQKILIQLFKNIHVAIWVTAFIFSAIHIQFFGFFPRMFLGALFGYLYVYGKSIWLPIIGHIINNGTVVLMIYVMKAQGKSMEEIEKSAPMDWYIYIISAIITLVLVWLYFKQAKKENLQEAYE